jgi:hypothetical protein
MKNRFFKYISLSFLLISTSYLNSSSFIKLSLKLFGCGAGILYLPNIQNYLQEKNYIINEKIRKINYYIEKYTAIIRIPNADEPYLGCYNLLSAEYGENQFKINKQDKYISEQKKQLDLLNKQVDQQNNQIGFLNEQMEQLKRDKIANQNKESSDVSSSTKN